MEPAGEERSALQNLTRATAKLQRMIVEKLRKI
jgi:hypothetical protein